MIETDGRAVLTTREQALALLRTQVAGTDLVDELIRERRAAALRDDA